MRQSPIVLVTQDLKTLMVDQNYEFKCHNNLILTKITTITTAFIYYLLLFICISLTKNKKTRLQFCRILEQIKQ